MMRHSFPTLPLAVRLVGLLGLGGALLSGPCPTLRAQSTPNSRNDARSNGPIAENPAAPKFLDPELTTWEFGLRIEATGAIQGITATCPLPVDWSEQTIEIVEELKTSTVGRMSFDEQPQNVKLLILKVPALQAGEIAEGTVRIRCHKRPIAGPEDPRLLMRPDPLPGKLKTYLQASPYIEVNDRAVREFADSIRLDSSLSTWEQVETIYDEIRQRIPYQFDPTIRHCAEAIERGQGDCEELSSLFIAVCRIKQIPARAVWIPDHTYPEFYLQDPQGEGFWFPCQLAGSRQFGEMNESRPILQKGDRFRTPGSSEPTRYLQPTLVAKDAVASPKLIWISRELKAD